MQASDQVVMCHLQIAVLDALAQLGCDPCGKDSVSSTPMHVAAGEGHIEAILKLVSLVSPDTPFTCTIQLTRPDLPLEFATTRAQSTGNTTVMHLSLAALPSLDTHFYGPKRMSSLS